MMKGLSKRYHSGACSVRRPGGVELYNRSEVIKVTNTLESRMDIIFHQVRPVTLTPHLLHSVLLSVSVSLSRTKIG